MTGSMQHIQFEEKEKVIAANGNAAPPNLNFGGNKLTYLNLDLKDMARPTFNI